MLSLHMAGHQARPFFGTRLHMCTYVPIQGISATFSAAQKRGRARDLWETAQELLEELAE